MSERARKSPRLLRRSSSVQVHSLSDLSKVTNEALTTKEDVEENDASSTTTFEEVPGAWSGGIDDEDVPRRSTVKPEESTILKGAVTGGGHMLAVSLQQWL